MTDLDHNCNVPIEGTEMNKTRQCQGNAKAFDFNAFCAFCKANGMALVDEFGNLTVQGRAVMESSNCIVAAGAGSGKTTVLSFRFLRMVAQGISPERILTITFTKKATAEMKGRIFELLKKGHGAGLVSNAAMAGFSNVSISTVDSFCAEVVRASAVHQGLPANFGIMDDDDLSDMSRIIVRKVLNSHYNEPAVKRLYSYFSVENIESVFLDLAQRHLNIAKPIDIDSCMSELIGMLDAEIKELKDERLSAEHPYNRPKKKEQFYMDALSDCDFMKDYYGLVREYEDELFSRKRACGQLSFNDVMQLAICILRDEVNVRDSFKSRFDSIMVDEFQDNNDDYRKLIYLLSEKSYEQGAVRSYDGQGIPTLGSLCQDKVFLVGDEKQSIYRFRGADVSVFKRLSSELCQEPIELRKNWRSEPSIIHFCNHVFPSVMECQDSADYEASYTPLEPRSPLIPKGRIVLLHPEVCSEDKDDSRSNVEREANVVAHFIKDMCSQGSGFLVPDDADKSVLRPPRPNEVGLLLKVGSHQAVFEKALTSCGVPYTVSEARSLVSDSVANDLYSALQACVYTYDRIHYASYLKSPFCSFTDRDLQVLFSKDDSKRHEGLSMELSKRLERADSNLAGLFDVCSKGSICKALEFMWFDMGYRDYMMSRTLNRPYADHFDYLYALGADFDAKGRNMVEFLDYLRPLLGAGCSKTKELSVFKEDVSGVQIMTIHKSKGLAFKVVVVADMQSGANGRGFGFQPKNFKHGDNVFLAYRRESNKAGASIKNPIKDIMSCDESSMENAEAKRVLYVAATRARHHLVFSGYIDLDNPNDRKRTPLHPDPDKNNSLLTYLLHSVDYGSDEWSGGLKGDGFELEEISMKPCFKALEIVDRDANFYRTAFDGAAVPVFKDGIPSRAVTQMEIHMDETPFNDDVQGSFGAMDGERRRLPSIASDPVIAKYECNKAFGTLVHKVIEDSIKGCSSNLSDFIPEKADEKEKTLLLADAKRMAKDFMEGELFRMLDGMALMSEKSFVSFDGGSFIEGTIDLLAVGGDSVYVIDFKTDSTCLANDHRMQLGQYARAASSMYPGRTVKAFVCYLRDVEAYLELA